MPQASETKKGTVDPDEIRHFARDSAHWWDSKGPFAPLHRLNPARMTYIKKQICAHYGLDFQDLKPFENLDILDIGCGGGLVCEPLARLGASVTGIDADENAVAAARTHAKQSGLAITYINGDAAGLNQKFDVVLALEIIEHVTDITAFVGQIAARVKPGGLVIFSTLNRTARSYALGIVAAEYILRWVPRGTHTWKKFVKPSELAAHARHVHLAPHDVTGLIYNPVANDFALSKTDLGVNYLMSLKAETA